MHGYSYELLNFALKITKPDETSIESKEIVASYIHELFVIKQDVRHHKRLLMTLENLMASAEQGQG